MPCSMASCASSARRATLWSPGRAKVPELWPLMTPLFRWNHPPGLTHWSLDCPESKRNEFCTSLARNASALRQVYSNSYTRHLERRLTSICRERAGQRRCTAWRCSRRLMAVRSLPLNRQLVGLLRQTHCSSAGQQVHSCHEDLSRHVRPATTP